MDALSTNLVASFLARTLLLPINLLIKFDPFLKTDG